MKRGWSVMRQTRPLVQRTQYSATCPRCIQASQAAFHTEAPRAFAFKWFKQSSTQSKQRDRWLQVLSKRRQGGLSHQEVTFMLECVDTIQLSEEELTESILAALRVDSEAHDELATKAYGLLQKHRAAQITPKSPWSGLEESLPQLVVALASAGPSNQALDLCKQASKKLDQSQDMWRVLLQTLAERSKSQDFFDACHCMREERVPADVATMNLELDRLNAVGRAQEALALYKSMPSLGLKPDTTANLLALDSCMQANDLEAGKDIATLVERDNSDAAFASLLAWDVYNRQPLASIHQKASSREVSLSTVNAMLRAAKLSRQWNMIEQLWMAFANTSDIFPNEATFSMRIHGHNMARQLDKAIAVFADSANAGFSELLDSQVLQDLLKAGIMSRKPDAAFEQKILAILLKQEPFPIAQESLSFLIPSLIEQKQYVQLETIIEQCQLRPDWSAAMTIQHIVDQATRAKDGKQVWNISILLRNLFWDDPIYTLELRSLLLKRLVALQDVDKLDRMFRQFFQSQIKPDAGMYTLMLHGGQDLREVELIRSVHASIKMDVNLSDHTRILTTLMRAYAHVSAAETFEVWNQIFHGGHGPTAASVSVVMDACAHMRMPTRGLFIWQTLERRQFPFNDNNYASLVEVFTRNGNPEGVLSLLEEAIASGRDVGPRTLSTLWNTARGMRSQTKAWANKHCPSLWQQLDSSARKDDISV
ncbi:hypothetical protein BCR37DRAFT_264965 [Protomyces lactucae-debilis]|uniref:Pentacotripeptide-repeat region of PRORP domain-containing protein n=1 Tax=Protomyces lactucae-debilis TaxID=2754530 RepID=A0A1Y2FK78_PROLT|nr:uncharacterized protein BCR37DRAFT_264965 [Protomyces lactucae-debilis]ORY84360.1 hypothetical protein BCR37DRAFT_264965 [Protomyces lactucae-debilis]